MFAATHSVALVGVEARPVRVEAHIGRGHRERLSLVGLPDTAIREAKDRVKAAMIESGYGFPGRPVTVNLAPADLPKSGSAYDLPIALAVLAASGELPADAGRVVALGELALDGSVRPARGGLASAIAARQLDTICLLSPENAAEASIAGSDRTRVVRSLAEAVSVASGTTRGGPIPEPTRSTGRCRDIADVRGQPVARRALEVSAAGAHHLLLTGPPGSGKTMLAQCVPGILPPLSDDAALEVAQVWSSAGRHRSDLHTAPMRAPHHTATAAALVGGGSGSPVPGELSLAHRGVLFLDELGEFPAGLLDALRQPLEDGSITIARKGVSARFPAEVQLIAATNPCPCGFHGDHRQPCRCTPSAHDRYQRRLSGPLIDRFDLRVRVDRCDPDALIGPPGEASAQVRARVETARLIQRKRGVENGSLGRSELDGLEVTKAAGALLARALRTGHLTGRGYDRVRRVARTIGDLAASSAVDEPHVAEALALRAKS